MAAHLAPAPAVPGAKKEAKGQGGSLAPALLVRAVTCATAFSEGYDMGVFSGVVVLLRKEVGLTTWQVGSLVGALYFAMALGAPLGASLADRWGRKRGLAATYAGLILGCLVLALSGGFAQLLLGRIILGVAIGAGFCVVGTFLAEVAPKDYRGSFVCVEDLFIILGQTTGYGANNALAGLPSDWRWMVGLGLVPTLLAMLLLLLPQLPESPRWLLLQGQAERARQCLTGMVGEAEASRLLEEWTDQKPGSWQEALCPSSRWRRNAVLSGCGILVLSVLSGVNVMTVYIGTLFAEELAERQAFQLAAFVGFLRVVAYAVPFVLLGMWGRRPLLLVSAAGATAAMAAMGLLYMAEAPVLPGKFLAMVGYNLAHAVGLGPVAWVYAPEVMPTDIRSKGVALGTFVARICTGTLTMGFPVACQLAGVPGVFGALAVVNLGGLCFVYCCVVETKGMALEEMRWLFDDAEDGPRPAAGGKSV